MSSSDSDDSSDLSPPPDLPIGVWDEDGAAAMERRPPRIPVRKLYVNNIPLKTRPADLIKLFGQFGEVVEAHVRKGRRLTKHGLPYAFVTFRNAEDARCALYTRRTNMMLSGRTLYVGAAKSCHQPDALQGSKASPKYEPATPINRDTDLEVYDEDVGYLNGERPCTINDLNDDCLMVVFSYFDIKDKLSFESVCKKWRRVLLDDWDRKIKLDLSKEFVGSRVLDDQKFKLILQRCGQSIKKLEMPASHHLTGEALFVIGCLCPALTTLTCTAIRCRSTSIRLIADKCINLRSLQLIDPIGLRDHDLKVIFENVPLESFSLTRRAIQGTCFPFLPPTIRRLEIDSCNELRMPDVILGLERAQQLMALKLDNCVNLTRSDFSEVCSKVQNIEELSISGYFRSLDATAMHSITLLNNLRILNLSWNGVVSDKLLIEVSKSCRLLEQLDVSGCRCTISVGVTDTSMKIVANNTSLTHLTISYLSGVTDDTLAWFAEVGRLKKLVCLGCPAITDDGCSRIITLCNSLEYVDLSGCIHVTNATVHAAMNIVNLRTEGRSLRLFIGGTRVREIPEPTSYLYVEARNNCVDRLRPDFMHDPFLWTVEDFSSSEGGGFVDGVVSGPEDEWLD